jgi:hypothetical protein
MIRACILAALTFCLGACGGGGKVYPTTLNHMHEVLAEVDELPPVFGEAAPDVSVESSDPKQVRWIVTLDGSELMRFVAELEPAGDHATQMTLHLTGATTGSRGDVQARMQQHPEIRNLYLVAMREEIESKLEERPFDITRTYGALSAATAANIGNISRQMDAVAEADRKRDEANIRKAYADEGSGY